MQEVDHDHEPNYFPITQERLSELVQVNNPISLEQAGGILQIAAALRTNIDTGIEWNETDIRSRISTFGINQDLEGQDPHNPMIIKKSFNHLILEALKDGTIIILFLCVALDLVIGIKINGPQQGFIDGAIICFTMFLVLNFSLLVRFLKKWLIMSPRKLEHLRRVLVSVVRSGMIQEIPVSELVVGDIIFLEAGNEVPADGLLIHGDSNNCTSIFKGTKVVEGNCRMLVTSVGKNTERSKLIEKVITNNLDHDHEPKFQASIDKMNSRLEKIWLTLSLLILSVQVFRCFMQKPSPDDDQKHSPDSKCVKNTVEEIMNESTKLMKTQVGKRNGLVSLLCILLFATRDGLPLGILVLCYCSSRKMKSFGANVQKLPACVTIGLVTTICLSKTNALHSELEQFCIGLNHIVDVPLNIFGQGVMEAVAAFRDMGIKVKLIVDDDIIAAKTLAIDCGIFRPGEDEDEESSIIEASKFRNISMEAQMDMVEKIHVMANASPMDKLLMVQCLKKKGEIVATTSSCYRDSPTLLEADVGILMANLHKEEEEEEAHHDIMVFGENNFETIGTMLRLGKHICKKIEIFLQLHLILNLSAFATNFSLEVLGNEVQLSSFHLLWTNLIVESFGSFALSQLVDPQFYRQRTLPSLWSYPIRIETSLSTTQFKVTSRVRTNSSRRILHSTEAGINLPPELVTKVMWKNIAIQSFFQVTILLILAVKGTDIFHVDENVISTMMFSCYVLCQVFLLIGNILRRSQGGIHENYLFLMIMVVIVVLQVLVVEILGFIYHWKKLGFKNWFICIGISAVPILPLDYAGKWIHLHLCKVINLCIS